MSGTQVAYVAQRRFPFRRCYLKETHTWTTR